MQLFSVESRRGERGLTLKGLRAAEGDENRSSGEKKLKALQRKSLEETRGRRRLTEGSWPHQGHIESLAEQGGRRIKRRQRRQRRGLAIQREIRENSR